MKKLGVAGCLMLLVSMTHSWSQSTFPDTLWVPVIFYDYHPDAQSDFERCTGGGMVGMVQANLDAQRKPIPTSLACPANAGNFPCACHLAEWFRVSGQAGSDNTLLFQCDSTTDPKKRHWYWATDNTAPFPGNLVTSPYANGRTGEFVGPNYNAAYSTDNVIVYDSLPFLLVKGSDGIYDFTDNSFFMLDNRGFGIEPTPGNPTPTHNYGFTMELHTIFKYKKGLTFNFKGDDDVWAFVNGQLVMDLGGLHQAETGNFDLDNANLIEGQNYTFDLFYAERHSVASDIRITSNIISVEPEVDSLFLNFFPPRDTIPAGDSIPFWVVLSGRDSLGRPMIDSNKLAKSCTWELLKSTTSASYMSLPTGTANPSNKNTFKAVTAYEWDTVIVAYTNPKTGAVLQGSKRVWVTAGPPARLLIQADTTFLPNDPGFTSRIGITTLSGETFHDTVYATLRDAFGNWVGFATQATWSSQNASIATVLDGAKLSTLGEGDIQRISLDDAATWGYAVQGQLKDSIQISLKANTNKLLEIRFFDAANPTVPLDTINLNTNQKMTVIAKARWSHDSTHWVDEHGTWTMQSNPDNVQWATPLPTGSAQLWPCDPVTSGQELLTVTDGDAITTIQHATVPVIITVGPPTKLTLKLVTSPDSCYAGQPIKIAAFLENDDGAYPGTYTGSSIYQDLLDNSLRALQPQMTIDGAPNNPLGKAVPEQFTNGIDTTFLTLYYAPTSSDSLHQIKLDLSGPGITTALENSTIRFRLRPGPIDSLQIENQNKQKMDTVKLQAPQLSVSLFVGGFDKFGNRIDVDNLGGDSLNYVLWRTDGTLHSVQPDSIGSYILFSGASALYPEKGNMGVFLTVGGKLIQSFLPIIITPAAPGIASAFTRDLNENGFIDRIDMVFNKKTLLQLADTAKFAVALGSSTWSAYNIVPLSSDSTSYALFVHELPMNVPQSSWLPKITITNVAGLQDVGGFATQDSCPPVVWKVVKTVSSTDHKTDVVEVSFSEKIKASDGGIFNYAANSPYLTFNAWDSPTAQTPIDPMFKGIDLFSQSIVNDSIVYFVMSNNSNLTDGNWVNFRIPATVKDPSGNVPSAVNQRVKVTLKGIIVADIFPNPSSGTVKRVPPGLINMFHEPDARTWVRNDHAGVIVGLTNIFRPASGVVEATLKIYDVVGNVVNWASTKNNSSGSLLEKNTDQSTMQQSVDIYWNGSNNRGMMVAPGVYRMVIYVTYPKGSNLQDAKFIKKVGIAR